MSFEQKTWKNRLSENPTRRTLTPIDGGTAMTVDVTRAEGTVMQQGDPFNADNMNDLERRIAEGIGGGDANIAPTEEGPQSENAYTVGQYLIYEGDLYKVISAISIGNSLVPNVNIQAVTVGNELSTVTDELSANGNRIYFDYKDGEYGYNTSSSRGADTFHPFKRMDGEITLVGTIRNAGWMSDGAGDSTSNSKNVTIKFQINNDGTCTLIEGSLVNGSSSSVGHVTPSQVTLNSSATFTISSITVSV